MPSVPSTVEAVKAQQKSVSELLKYFDGAKKPQVSSLTPKHQLAMSVSAKVAAKIESMIKNVQKGKQDVVASRITQVVTLLRERREKLNDKFLKLKEKEEKAKAVKSSSKKKSSKKGSKKAKSSPNAESNLFRLFGGYDLYESDAASDANSDLMM